MIKNTKTQSWGNGFPQLYMPMTYGNTDFIIPQRNLSIKSTAGHRPVMLVEVIRKCWISLIIHKINRIWNKHEILHNSQHGFRARRGTDTAHMGLQVMFEQAERSNSPLYLSSWDISKAFDFFFFYKNLTLIIYTKINSCN